MYQMHWYREESKNGRYILEFAPMFTRARFEWTEDLSDMTAFIEVTDEFKYLVNDLSANFTSLELKQFTQLKSTYSKTAYRLLKQFRSKGYREFDLEEFKLLFGIPKSYRATNVQKRVLEPIQKELKDYFLNLEINPVKKRTHGNPIIAYRFRWQPELVEDWEPQKFDKKKLATSKRVNRSKKANDPSWYDDKETHQASDEIIRQAQQMQEKRKSE